MRVVPSNASATAAFMDAVNDIDKPVRPVGGSESFTEVSTHGKLELKSGADHLMLVELKSVPKEILLTSGFASCPNICLVTLANLSWAYNLLTPEEKAKIQVVFISVDPARDAPEHLRDYVSFHNPAFLGATGASDELTRTAKDYGVFFAADAPDDPAKPNEYNVTHSA